MNGQPQCVQTEIPARLLWAAACVTQVNLGARSTAVELAWDQIPQVAYR